MRAIVVREHGGPEQLRLEERETPKPAADEVRIRVRAAGLNHLDLWVRRGIPGVKYPLPLVPGCDAAGEVDEAGERVSWLARGQKVLVAPGLSCGRCRECAAGRDHLCRFYGILGETRDGGCAEYVVVPAVNALPMPARLSFEEAAAIPLVFLTAWHMLVERARVRPGETVLVHAGGSGVGSAAIQIAKLWGARVLTTVGSEEKAAHARRLGADETILYRTQDFAEEARRRTGKRGVDVVLEHVGADTWRGSLRALAKGGRLVTCGATSGNEVTSDLRLIFFKSLSILGSTMGSRGELIEALEHVEAGRLRPILDRVFPLAATAEAHRHLEERRAFGKVVVVP